MHPSNHDAPERPLSFRCGVDAPGFAVPHQLAEKAIGRVLWLSGIAMLAEIVTGYLSGSMALLADGWHMGTHVAAMGLGVFAYRYIRRHAGSGHYSFGPGKVSYLAGYSSSLLLAVAAISMLVEALSRLRTPQDIHHEEALLVAILGLAVNLASAWLLHGSDAHGHGHDHDSDGHRAHAHSHDHNLRAAYLHVLADALTSIAAIAALLAGMWAGMDWLDPVVAGASGVLILRWAWHLARDSAGVLLDRQVDGELADAVRACVDAWGGQVLDVHIWLLAPRMYALELTVTGPDDLAALRASLAGRSELAHVTIDRWSANKASVASQQTL